MPPTLLDARELAAQLDAGYDDVLSWTRRGIIPAIKANGRYFYNLAKVCKAIRAVNARKPEPEAAEVAAC